MPFVNHKRRYDFFIGGVLVSPYMPLVGPSVRIKIQLRIGAGLKDIGGFTLSPVSVGPDSITDTYSVQVSQDFRRMHPEPSPDRAKDTTFYPTSIEKRKHSALNMNTGQKSHSR